MSFQRALDLRFEVSLFLGTRFAILSCGSKDSWRKAREGTLPKRVMRMEVRILIAEPDGALRDVFERYLARRGFLVETAGTLGECIEKAVAFEPDVIMSELDFSDDQAFRSMLQCSTTAVPIVVVTRQSRESGTQFGWPVAEYFEKPVPMARLAEALRKCAKHPDVSVA